MLNEPPPNRLLSNIFSNMYMKHYREDSCSKIGFKDTEKSVF
jgi:hypothetical protein